MAKGDRFVAIPADRMLAELRSIGEAIKSKRGGYREETQGYEIVAVLIPPGGRIVVRVYTTLALGGEVARDCGEDAIRIVRVAPQAGGKDRPVSKAIKILRTAPRKLEETARVDAFLRRLRGALRESYGLALGAPLCPLCGRVMARREGVRGAFFGCLGYPECRGTLPA